MFEEDKETGEMIVKIFNSEYLPLELQSIALDDKILLGGLNDIIQTKNLKDRYEYKEVAFSLPKEEIMTNNFLDRLSFSLSILGSDIEI